jgi:ABC-type amino acid transport substrate-binding protein
MRAAAAAALALACLAPAPGAVAVAEALRMGVRADARPFVYRDGDGTYRGFIYDLCRAAAASAGHPEPEHVLVTAGGRFAAMGDPDAPLDLLCDPTTITLERARDWDFTPIVFVANSTFLRRTPVQPLSPEAARLYGCEAADAERIIVAGRVGGTTAEQALDLATEGGLIRTGDDEALCQTSFDDHAQGFDALCGGEDAISYYFGDADILAAHLAARQAAPEGCPAAFASGFTLYEPYALVVGDRTPAFRRGFIHGVYAFFRDGGGERAFYEHFPGRRMAPALDTLFRLYRIPAGEPAPAHD